MLTDADLNAIRADLAGLLPDTCTVRRKAESVDSAGNVTETYSDQATGVACRIDPLAGRGPDVVALRESSLSFYQLTLPHDQDVQPGDRIVAGGQTYELVQLRDEHSWRACVRAVIALIEGG
jgi:hypothetical protein